MVGNAAEGTDQDRDDGAWIHVGADLAGPLPGGDPVLTQVPQVGVQLREAGPQVVARADGVEQQHVEQPQARGVALQETPVRMQRRAQDAAREGLGPFDVLINNAGIQHLGAFADKTDERRDRQLAVNLLGPMLGCRLAARRMAGRGGWIVNVGSEAGVRDFAGGATYCATKHAVVGQSDALRIELAPAGIGVTVVIPGVVNTDLAAAVKSAGAIAPVPPRASAAAIADAVRRERPEVWVPGSVRRAYRALGLLPQPLARAVERRTGIDRVLLDVDSQARAAYEARISAT